MVEEQFHSPESDQLSPEQEDNQEKFPILFLDVNLGHGRVERLIIYDGDKPMDVAIEFCEKYSKY